MSVLNFLKSGTGMATAGTVGIGGAAAALFGMGVFGFGESESVFTLPKTNAKTFISFNEGKALQSINNLKQSDSKGEDEVDRTNDYFGNISISCLNFMFPGVNFPTLDKFKLDKKPQTKTDDWPKLIQPIQDSSSTVHGCSSMVLSRDAEFFLMTSEAVVKRGKVGMALWTGMKNMGRPYGQKLKVKTRNFVSFFKSENGKSWKSLGGYSWGWKEENNIMKITFQTPGNKINETISSRTASFFTTTHKAYYGIWKSGQGKSSLLDITKINYKSQDTFSPNKAFVMSAADYFLSPSNDYSRETAPWKKYCVSGNSCNDKNAYKIDVGTNIQNWLNLFKNQKGSWVSAST